MLPGEELLSAGPEEVLALTEEIKAESIFQIQGPEYGTGRLN